MTTFLEMTISLDGFVAASGVSPEHPLGVDGQRVHDWMFHGSDADRDIAAAMFANTGAVLIGRRTFDLGIEEWGDDGAFGRPCFVVTHRPAETLVKGPTTFTFVTEGVERALALAREAAGGRDVCVMGGARLGQQVMAAGLADELRIHIAPVLFGAGTRLFEDHGDAHVALERTSLVETAGATHLTYRVLR
jgi:dihydrofolate reductase